MRLELALIPIIFALATAALTFLKPVEFHSIDLSSIFIYWPESLYYAERGDPTAIYRITGLVTCLSKGVIEAPPGISFKVLKLICRFNTW